MSEFDNSFVSSSDSFEEFDKKDIDDNTLMAVLSYIGLLVLIPIFAAKESKFARFHANQGLVLLITQLIVNAILIAVCLSSGIMGIVSGNIMGAFANALIPILISYAVGALFFILMILGIVNAATGKAKQLPVIGKFTILK